MAYLLIPIYPILAIVCLLTFTYERIAQNEQERLENTFIATQYFFMGWNVIVVIISIPAAFLDQLCGCGPLVRWSAMLIFSPFLLLWGLVRSLIWDTLFREIVPAGYSLWNKQVYQDLRRDSQQIRVLEILRGSLSSTLKVRLAIIDMDADVDHIPYEALSYSWGGHLMLRRLIIVNDRYYFVADTVFNALKELRLPHEKRRIWIDAICIHQSNYEEKGQQVALMGLIYRRAQAVIVWLGKASVTSECAFSFAENVATVDPSRVNSICAEWPGWQAALQEMMRSRWWSRVWIVQEVALAPNVVVRSGHYKIAWQTLVTCLQHLSRVEEHGLDTKVMNFVNNISELKCSDIDPKNGLLELAICFRDRVAGDPRDKLIGFCGLLKSTASGIPMNPYQMRAPELFAHFAAYWVKKTGSQAVIALAANRATDGTSWVPDWVAMTSADWREHDPLAFDDTYSEKRDVRIDFWNGGLLDSVSARTGRKYSAVQNVPARIREGKPGYNTVYLAGWQSDVVKHCGDPFDRVENAARTIRSWEKLAGGPWTCDTDSDRFRFIRTLVADAAQSILSQNWPELFETWLPALIHPERHPEAQATSDERIRGLVQLIWDCCYNRRFFVTEHGRFGLGPEKIHRRDCVCMILGADVPFILQKRWKTKYYFKGQAFVDGLMDYHGDLVGDLQNNSLDMREFHVL